MLRMTAIAAVTVAACCFADVSQAQVRGYRSFKGHGFGPHAAIGFYGPYYSANNFFSYHRPETLPYFAKHPPVYYSDQIVYRPYGVSPYAAPPGLVPAEYQLLEHPTGPQHIVNPYYQQGQDGAVAPPEIQAPDDQAPDAAPSESDQEDAGAGGDQDA